MSLIRRLRRDRRGATSIEYSLILALIAAISVASFDKVGTNLAMVMNSVAYVECRTTEALCVMSEPN